MTSMPLRRKETAAVEITALAAGAGPPANRIATRLMGLSRGLGEAAWACRLGGDWCGGCLRDESRRPPRVSCRCGTALMGRFLHLCQDATTITSSGTPRWSTVAAPLRSCGDGSDGYPSTTPRPTILSAPGVFTARTPNVRSINVVSTRASMKAVWLRISWCSGIVVLMPSICNSARARACRRSPRRGSADGRSACRSSSRSRARRRSRRRRANRSARRTRRARSAARSCPARAGSSWPGPRR